MDQLTIDTQLSQTYPGIIPGTIVTINCVDYQYTGLDVIMDQIDTLTRDHPELLDLEVARNMMADPLGYRPPTRFQMDPSISHALTGNIGAALAGGAVATALQAAVSSGALKDVMGNTVGGLAGDILSGAGAGAALGGALSGSVGGVLNGALGGGIGGALGGIASGFMPPGLDGPVEAVKGAIGGVMKSLPFKMNGAADIVNQIVSVKSTLQGMITGPASALFKSVGGSFLSDIPGADALANVVSLQSQVASLAGMASNPIAFAAQAAGIKQQFPMINVNAIAGKMVAGAITGALGGAGFNIGSMVPNMALAGGLSKLLPMPGRTPTMDAMNAVKTAKPPKPKKPIEMKNLFAEGAAAGAMSSLKQPLSMFMGMQATIAPQTPLVAKSASATSYGNKLVGNANSVNWSSGGYGRETKMAQLEQQRMDLAAKVEMHTQELLAMVDYTKLTSCSYQTLTKKYPRIKPTMSVLEALCIIEEDDELAAAREQLIAADVAANKTYC